MEEKKEVATKSPLDDEKLLVTACHLGGLAGLVFPFGNVIVPLVIWLVKKDQFPRVNTNGKEALNFQISMSIAMIVAFFLMFIFIGIFVMGAILIVDLIFIIQATIAANNGKDYHYPYSIKFIK